jgi:hypothetical protein
MMYRVIVVSNKTFEVEIEAENAEEAKSIVEYGDDEATELVIFSEWYVDKVEQINVK